MDDAVPANDNGKESPMPDLATENESPMPALDTGNESPMPATLTATDADTGLWTEPTATATEQTVPASRPMHAIDTGDESAIPATSTATDADTRLWTEPTARATEQTVPASRPVHAIDTGNESAMPATSSPTDGDTRLWTEPTARATEQTVPASLEEIEHDPFLPFPEADSEWTQFKIMKNTVAVSFSFLFLFTSFQSLSNLQTSLNMESEIGSQSLLAIYTSLIVSCIFLPKFVIAHFGCKWTIPVSMLLYTLYMVANIFPKRWLMILTGIGVGIGGGPLWSAKCTYLTQIGIWYADLTNQSEDAVINKLFGFFFMLFQTSQVWGNLISSTVLNEPPASNVIANTTVMCGAEFSPPTTANEDTTQQFRQPAYLVRNLCIIYLSCAVAAMVIVSLLLDPIKLDQETSEEDRKLSHKLLVATVKHLVSSPSQILLVPLTMYSGIEQAFIAGEFTQAFISCCLGVKNVGYIMICYGVTDSACCILFGRLVQYAGHTTFFGLATLVHGSLQIVLLSWVPSSNKTVTFYIIAASWGMGDAVIQTQINALYGAIFTENTEAAFANYRLWESLGFAMSFWYHAMLTIRSKLYICIAFLLTGMVGYAVVEVTERRKLSRLRHHMNT